MSAAARDLVLVVGLGGVGAWIGGASGALTGAAVAGLAVVGRAALTRLGADERLGAVVGAVAGALVAGPLAGALEPLAPAHPLAVVVTLALLVLGAQLGRRLGAELGRPSPATTASASNRILDTSAIIDGRLTGVAEAGFLDGRVLLPAFVLRELQAVADSSDGVKRGRGRRGLDTLQRLRERDDLEVEVIDDDPEGSAPVDEKLVEVALARSARIVTTDYNLNKVAALRGVTVVNVNDLANALKPVVVAGEVLCLSLTRKGTEQGQGVGYLDDGTMVVVDGGQEEIGQRVDCVVTSVHQSSAGKMIFARRDGGRGRQPRRVEAQAR